MTNPRTRMCCCTFLILPVYVVFLMIVMVIVWEPQRTFITELWSNGSIVMTLLYVELYHA